MTIEYNIAIKRSFCEAKIWGKFAGFFLLIAVRRPERSESPQGVARILRSKTAEL